MQQITASRAKQNFGELLEALAQGPVAIERHKKVRAIICSAETFGHRPDAVQAMAERRAARSAQQLVEKDRLIKHQRLAIELLTMPEAQRDKHLLNARAEVQRWRRDRLCSRDYADRWDALLNQPLASMVRAMCDDSPGWGPAIRQNSPWSVMLPQ